MASGRITPTGSTTPSTKTPAEQEAEHRAALAAGAKDEDPSADVAKVEKSAEVVTIKFLCDGLTAWGHVWVSGEEVSIRRGSESWKETCRRDGKSFLDLDEDGQRRRWNKIYFRRMPNPENLDEIKEPRSPRI